MIYFSSHQTQQHVLAMYDIYLNFQHEEKRPIDLSLSESLADLL